MGNERLLSQRKKLLSLLKDIKINCDTLPFVRIWLLQNVN